MRKKEKKKIPALVYCPQCVVKPVRYFYQKNCEVKFLMYASYLLVSARSKKGNGIQNQARHLFVAWGSPSSLIPLHPQKPGTAMYQTLLAS